MLENYPSTLDASYQLVEVKKTKKSYRTTPLSYATSKDGGTMTVGNVVEKYKIENTTIKICDDACRDKNDEYIRKVLDKCSDIARLHMSGDLLCENAPYSA